MMYEKNRVIIRIWHSAFNKQKGENVGHVSIEIPSIKVDNPKYNASIPNSQREIPFYVSFWPGSPSRKAGLGMFFGKRDPHYMGGYASDQEAEKGRTRLDGKPETTICLYSLDKRKVYGKFEKVKNKVNGWTLLGSNKFFNSGSKESCASFAYKLLNAGGIYDLVPSRMSSKFSSTVTPDNIAIFVIKAKRRELKKYPKTKIFNYNGETESAFAQKSSCIMM